MFLGEESEQAVHVSKSRDSRGRYPLTIQVLGRDDESSKEDTVPRAVHALCDLGEPRLESVEVDEGAEEGRDLHVGLFDEDGDEGLERRECGRLVGGGREGDLGGRRRRRWQCGGRSRATLDDLDSLLGEVG